MPQKIHGNQIEDQTITSADISTGAVITGKVNANAITGAKISDSAVASNKLAADAVVTAKLADSAVASNKLAASAVVTSKLNAGAVTGAKISDAAVASNKLGSSSVVTSKINAGAVTGAKISDAAVASNKLAASAVVTSKINAGAVTGAKISNSAVTSVKLGASCVTSAKVVAGTLLGNQLSKNITIRNTLTVSQDLIVTATKLSMLITDLSVSDAFIRTAANASSASPVDGGLEVWRGSEAVKSTARLAWKETSTAWFAGRGNLGNTNLKKVNIGDVIAYGNIRPASPISGQQFLDTSIGKPIWWNGANWIIATGSTV
jgi:hypothetical protein